MLDVGTVRDIARVLVVLAIAGIALLARSMSRPAGRVLASRSPVRGSEAAWLGATVAVQGWTLGVLVAPAWFYAWPSMGNFPDSTDVQLLGPALWLLGMGLLAWGVRTLGRYTTVAIQVTEGHRLVQEGPYAWIRHPIYTGNAAAALGLAVLYLSPPLLVLALLLIGLATYRGRIEDDFLRSPEAFGASYDAYVARTGRFLPRLRSHGSRRSKEGEP